MACGAASVVQEANEEIQAICDQMKVHVEAKCGRKFGSFEATHFRSQVVAGTNYFIKVHVGNGSYLHLRVFQTLPFAGQNLELVAMLMDKTEDDELNYFDKGRN
ncbi:predicted protein [Nematostella vectensis]|uniref:Cystatin domain-containing protein n=1 Tax=Nematostella vectensis TaxID=45351 RepID=A7SC06_NEMVE|nr:cystatin-B [Nematostella vectensis]EDO38753.1 predicted protein [Nematostella vectensis]|eukprot:XP_001630816.1 predicted protein [Nematostella vectensis]